MSKPIYRYASRSAKPVVDGAIFAFVEGTDLEIAVLIQVRATETKPQWEVAFARMSDYQLAVNRGEALLWEVEQKNQDSDEMNYSCPTVEFRDAP